MRVLIPDGGSEQAAEAIADGAAEHAADDIVVRRSPIPVTVVR